MVLSVLLLAIVLSVLLLAIVLSVLLLKGQTMIYKQKDRQYNGQKKDRQYNGQKKDRQHNGQKRKDKQRSHLAVSLFNVPDCGILSTISRYFSDFRDALIPGLQRLPTTIEL
jgi:mannitol-specific phosphotransferase system IIBC component